MGAAAFLPERLAHFAWKETLADLIPGLTHDFNNVLTGILAVSEAHLGRMDGANSIDESLGLVRQKAQEACRLIHYLARLCHERPGTTCYVDLNSLVAEAVELLRKVLPRRIEIEPRLHSPSLPVYTDGVELRRVLLGLSLSLANAAFGPRTLQLRTAQPSQVAAAIRSEIGRPCRNAACVRLTVTGAELTAEQMAPGPGAGGLADGTSLALEHARRFVKRNHGAFSAQVKAGGVTTVAIWLAEADFTEAPSCPD